MRTLKRVIKYIRQVYHHTARIDAIKGGHIKRSWREAARRISLESGVKVSAGTLIRVAHGYEPKAADTRRALGMAVYVLLKACDSCGEVHPRKKACASKAKVAGVGAARLRWTPLTRWPVGDLFDEPITRLAWRIRNRIEVEKGGQGNA
jgi:hypothetical protein